MADLEEQGLLYAPHTSAGRVPTEEGLKVFVNGVIETTKWDSFKDEEVYKVLEKQSHNGMKAVLEQATEVLSELSNYAGIVFAPKCDLVLKKIEFVSIKSKQLLVILISESGNIENRIISSETEWTPDQLETLSHHLSACIDGKTLNEGLKIIKKEISKQKKQFSQKATLLVQKGLEALSHESSDDSLILKGHSNLLEHIDQMEELEVIRQLFESLEAKKNMLALLDAASKTEGLQVFIGSQNPYFDIAGCSLVASSYRSTDSKIVGAIGVIGPASMEYRKVIPLVNYTSRLISRFLENS
jgi:heat-inducible transcriptional repressor